MMEQISILVDWPAKNSVRLIWKSISEGLYKNKYERFIF